MEEEPLVEEELPLPVAAPEEGGPAPGKYTTRRTTNSLAAGVLGLTSELSEALLAVGSIGMPIVTAISMAVGK